MGKNSVDAGRSASAGAKYRLGLALGSPRSLKYLPSCGVAAEAASISLIVRVAAPWAKSASIGSRRLHCPMSRLANRLTPEPEPGRDIWPAFNFGPPRTVSWTRTRAGRARRSARRLPTRCDIASFPRFFPLALSRLSPLPLPAAAVRQNRKAIEAKCAFPGAVPLPIDAYAVGTVFSASRAGGIDFLHFIWKPSIPRTGTATPVLFLEFPQRHLLLPGKASGGRLPVHVREPTHLSRTRTPQGVWSLRASVQRLESILLTSLSWPLLPT